MHLMFWVFFCIFPGAEKREGECTYGNGLVKCWILYMLLTLVPLCAYKCTHGSIKRTFDHASVWFFHVMCVFMVSLPLAQLHQKQTPSASLLPPKIPHPSHLQVPAVEPPNTPTWLPHRPSALYSQNVHHTTAQPHSGPPPPPLYLLLPFACWTRPLIPPLSPHFTSLLHSSPSALPRPRWADDTRKAETLGEY